MELEGPPEQDDSIRQDIRAAMIEVHILKDIQALFDRRAIAPRLDAHGTRALDQAIATKDRSAPAGFRSQIRETPLAATGRRETPRSSPRLLQAIGCR
jgi:hypothetical protein